MEIRKATIQDVDQMQSLIQRFADLGLMLPRSAKSLCESLHCFSVAVEGSDVIGVGGLHILWKDLAEIRSLAVHPDAHGRGIGRLIVEKLIQEAEQLGVPQVLSLTYQTAFFQKLQFTVIQRECLPHKVWKDCIYCRKFDHCDEVAMVYYTRHHVDAVTMEMVENL